MDRLNKAISDVAFILDNLILLRQIQNTGNCNICKNRDCGYIPKAGQMVRYNCPFFKAESGNKCKNCEYYINPDYTRCHTCKAESED